MLPCINATISIIQSLQHNFPKMRGGGRVNGHLEFFQKFIRFGSGTLPEQSDYVWLYLSLIDSAHSVGWAEWKSQKADRKGGGQPLRST